MITTTLSLDWLGIYTTYADSGLNKQDDEIVRVATFSPQALESVPNLPATYVDEPEEEPYVRSIRMTVPNGTILEFESTNPEQFALQFMHQSVEAK